MKKLIYLLFISLLLLNISCEKETSSESISETNFKNIKIINGRLSFKSKESFKIFYNDMKDKDEDELATILNDNFYSKDFYSLIPIISEKTKAQAERHFNKFKENNQSYSMFSKDSISLGENISDEDIFENFDDIEEIMGEDVFESFLNENAEILVEGKVYKYTDKGLLIADVDFVQEMYDFMEANDVKSLSDIGEIDTSGEYPLFNTDGGLKSVTDKVDSYLADKTYQSISLSDDAYLADASVPFQTSTGGSSGSSSTSTTSTQTNIQDLINEANNLAKCTPSSPWLGNLFGTTKVCIKRFGAAQRVKLKYYSVDFYLAYAIGVKVKHQHKGWLWWSRQNTPEMALGINSISWYFNHNKMFSNTTNSSITNYYTYDGKLYSSFNSYNNAIFVDNGRPIPALPFASTVDVIIEVANNELGINLTEYQIREFFYSQLYQEAKNITDDLGRPMNKVGVIINQNGQTVIQYYNFTKRCNNCSRLEKVFDWGIATPQMNYTFGAGDSFEGDFGFGSLNFDFRHPDITHLNIYGMARREGSWHGYKMIF